MEKKKREPVFLSGGLLRKTATLPTAASLQRASEERSPLLKSFHLNERLPLVSTSPVRPQRCIAAVGATLGSMGNVQSGPRSTHSLRTAHANRSAFPLHVFIVAVTAARPLNAENEAVSLPAMCVCVIPFSAHLDGTCRGSMSVMWKRITVKTSEAINR